MFMIRRMLCFLCRISLAIDELEFVVHVLGSKKDTTLIIV